MWDVLRTFLPVIRDNAWINTREEPSRPTTVMVEVTNRCNLDCAMCGSRQAHRPRGNIALDLFREVTQQSAALGVRNMALHTVGEPLLNRQLPELITIAHRAGLDTFLSSNGQLLDPAWTGRLLESPLGALRISVDAADAEGYARVRRGGDWQRLLNNLAHFRRERERRGYATRLHVTAIVPPGEGMGFMRRVQRRFRGLCDGIHFSHLSNPGGQITTPGIRVAGGGPTSAPCRLLWRTMVINWDGTATACCLDFDGRLPVGDLRHESLEAIWRGPLYRQFRAWHRQGELQRMPLCGACPKEVNSAPRLAWLNLKGMVAGWGAPPLP